MQDKKNILFLPRWYPTSENPLDGIFIHRHAIAVNQYCNVYVLFARVRDQKERVVFERIFEDGIEIHRYFYRRRHTGIGFVDKYIRFRLYNKCLRLGFKNLLFSHDVDLIHVHVLLRNALFALKVLKKYRIPFIVTEHWTGYLNNLVTGVRKTKTRKVFGKAGFITSVSQPLLDAMSGLTKNKNLKVVPNVVDVNVFTPRKKELDDEKIILHISDLNDAHKNISGTIRAFSALLEVRKDVKLHIIGRGPDEGYLRHIVETDEDIKEYIAFKGELEEEEVVKELQQCTFLSLFSNYETFGVVLIEALACGKPVVATNLPAIKSIISNDYGILVEPGREDQLMESYNYMLNNIHSYKIRNLRNYVNVNFGYDTVGKQFDKIYTKVLELDHVKKGS